MSGTASGHTLPVTCVMTSHVGLEATVLPLVSLELTDPPVAWPQACCRSVPPLMTSWAPSFLT